MTVSHRIILLASLFTLVGCVRTPSDSTKWITVPIAFNPQHETTIPVVWDTLYMPVNMDDALTSMSGRFIVKDSLICFADGVVSMIHAYDTLGKWQNTPITHGNGSQKVRSIYSAVVAPDGHLAIFGNHWNFAIFDAGWNKTDSLYFDFTRSKRSFISQWICPDPNFYDIYEAAYDRMQFACYGNHTVIFPITSEHPFFNGYQGPNVRKFYKYARTIGMLDLESKSFEMFGHFPPVYRKRKIPNFMHVSFDVAGDTLYLSYNADSLIYKTDLKTKKIFGAFGEGVRNMNTDYPRHRNFEEADRAVQKDRSDFGYYGNLFYDPVSGLLFRTCYQGGSRPYDLMQVYRGDRLAGTFEVPHLFQLFGTLNGTFYGTAVHDIENERFIIYKFRIR